MPTQVIPIEGIDKAGVIYDSPASTLPPGAWTDALNIRFDDGAIRRMKGQTTIFTHPDLTDIQHVVYWENPNVRCYVVINRERAGDTAYLVTVGGDGATIVSPKGVFTRSNNWTSTQFNGGYSIIINNGINAPQHITVQLGGTSNINSIATFEPLPNWESYASGGYASDFVTVSADILIAYGNLLVAGALTERSLPQLPAITGGTASNTNRTVTFTFASQPVLEAGDRFTLLGDPDYTWNYLAQGDGTLLVPNENRTLTSTSPYNTTYQVMTKGINSLTVFPVDNAGVRENFGDVATDLTLPSVSRTFTADGVETTVPPSITELPPFSPSGDITSYFVIDSSVSAPPPQEIVRDLNGVVRTSAVAAPGQIPQNWNPFAVGPGTADEIVMADAGRITAIKELRGNLFVYTSDTINQLRVSGQGLTVVPITKEYGALTQSGVFGFQGTHFIVGSDDIYIFAGNPGDIKSVADGRVRHYFYDTLHPVSFRNMEITRNQQFDELWLCYPTSTSSSGDLNEALVWSYVTNTWTRRELPDVRSVTTGPIPGEGFEAEQLDFSGFTPPYSYELTVTNANGQTTVQPSPTFPLITDFLRALNDDINGQAGLASRIVTSNSTILVNDARLGMTPWTYSVTVNGVPVIPTIARFTGATSDRPWPINVLNEARNFPILARAGDIQAAEVGFDGFTMDRAFLERRNLHFTPERETERLAAIFMTTTSAEANTRATVILTPADSAATGLILPFDSTSNNPYIYSFELRSDYKIDTRITSRLVNWRIEVDGNSDWTIDSLALEVGQRGTR